MAGTSRGVTRVHLDTDFGGDPDDACALAMLLGWPDLEIVGITTNLDEGGRRAGCVRAYLDLVDTAPIPVVAGAAASLTTGRIYDSTWGDTRYWPDTVTPRPAPPGAALDQLTASIELGATVIAIGALTNLAELELRRPGTLHGVPVVAMAGWVRPPAEGLPAWGPERDFNVQCDTRAAAVVASAADLTLVTLPATASARLRAADLPRLRAAGPLGRLLARQSEVYSSDTGTGSLGRAHDGLPDDLVNFHWDPVTSAVAAGWPGVVIEEMSLLTQVAGGVLRFSAEPTGRATRVVVEVDGPGFGELWLARVTDAGRRSEPG